MSQEEPVERALQLVREERPADWPAVSDRIRTRLRGVLGPSQSFRGFAEGGSPSSRVTVSSRVLLPQLRARLDDADRVADVLDLVPGTDPAAPRGRAPRLSEVRVELVCRYGADLHGQGEQVRRAVAEVLRRSLGVDPGFDPERDITVRVVDVVAGDPRQS